MDAIVSKAPRATTTPCTHEVLVVGGGAGGIAVASSLLRRAKDVDIAIVEPADVKARVLPRIDWQAMPRGREPLAKPKHAA